MKRDPLITDIIYHDNKKKLEGSRKEYRKLLFFNDDDFEQFVPVPPQNGVGGFRIIRLRDNLGIIITNHWSGDSPVTARTDALTRSFKFTFNFSPKPVIIGIERNNIEYIAAPSNAYILSPNIVLDISIPRYNHQMWLSVVIGPALLKQTIESLKERLPKAFNRVVDEPDNGYYFHESRYTPRVQLVLEQILNCAFSGSLKRIYLEGKAIELIALRFGLLLNETGEGYHSVPLTATDIEKLHYIESILKTRISTPPSLIELSNLVGINITKLKNGFKTLFGVSVGKYILNIRMEQARYLLKHGGLNVSEASSAVGYKSLSHFTVMFKTKYGFYPSTCVKMRNHSRN
ncbi:MAG: helix-turn-helix transcriptional regulator [Spirochaetes bacterium]|nr:helix-turn-helix transcriptional regulator [Spirochaetota bacterium]